jgi:hypothetical protein
MGQVLWKTVNTFSYEMCAAIFNIDGRDFSLILKHHLILLVKLQKVISCRIMFI